MIDIIIPINQATTWEHNELRFTLRSFEMYLPDMGNVYIIGHKPAFITNVVHVPFREKSMYPAINMCQKIKRACELDVSNIFLYAADDHFLLPGFVFDAAYYDGDLEDRLRDPDDILYKKTLRNTLEHLISAPDPVYKNFDMNTPMLLQKECFLASMAQVDWEKPWGYCIKSIYGNHFDIPGVAQADGKIRVPKPYDYLREFIKDKVCLSTGMRINDDFKRLLTELYPNKSKYEQ
jgi:hypothetical protein